MNNEIDTNIVATAVIVELSKSFAKDLCSFISRKVVDMKCVAEIELGSAYETYLNSTKTCYGKVKTLLYRHEPKDIYSFYECIGLQFGENIIDTSNIINITELGHRIVITGTGGIGKSIMMRHLFLNSIKSNMYVPILVELRGLNSSKDKEGIVASYIYETIKKFNFSLERKYFDYSLEMGRYIILFDGYDEIRSDLSEQISKEIIDLCDKYPENYYIVSSRPLNEFVGWSQFLELESKSLTKKQAMSLINKLDFEPEIKHKFHKELNTHLFNKYESFASNPLLLNIMLITYENSVSIPDKLNDFYEQAFSALFHTHDATKGAYKRDIRCNLGCEDFRSVFSYFCFKSFFKSQYEFTENQILDYINSAINKLNIKKIFLAEDYLVDLTNSVCMLVHEGLNYRFAHRSFQEYFSALYAAQLEDTIQKKFLTSWIKENNHLRTSSFLDRLYDLQPKRFIANIIIPGLLELRDNYVSNGSSKYWFCETTYGDLSLIDENSEEKYYSTSIIIENHYNYFIVDTVKNIGNYHSRIGIKSDALKNAIITHSKDTDKDIDIDIDLEAERNSKNLKRLNGFRKKFGSEIDFATLKSYGVFEEIIETIPWVIDDFQYAMEFLEEYENSSSTKKRKYESILDEL